MNKFQLEAWTLRVIDNVINGRPNEDSFVELKSEWVEPANVARQLAGHANAARGELILWIIGIDERNQKITGASERELSNWLGQLSNKFVEKIPPTLSMNLNVPYQDNAVVALLFETDRFPYMIKYNEEIYETPWREGNRTRSAKRSDLIKLLEPLQLLPDLEILEGEVTLYRSQMGFYFSFRGNFYVTPKTPELLVIPFRQSNTYIEIQNSNVMGNSKTIRATPPWTGGFGSSSRSLSKTIESTEDEVLIHGPGRLIITAEVMLDLEQFENPKENLNIKLSLLPTGATHSLIIQAEFHFESAFTGDPHFGHWIYSTE